MHFFFSFSLSLVFDRFGLVITIKMYTYKPVGWESGVVKIKWRRFFLLLLLLFLPSMKSASVAKTNSELKACFSFYITFIIISSGGGESGVFFFLMSGDDVPSCCYPFPNDRI